MVAVHPQKWPAKLDVTDVVLITVEPLLSPSFLNLFEKWRCCYASYHPQPIRVFFAQ
jgi:hypothetical protein